MDPQQTAGTVRYTPMAISGLVLLLLLLTFDVVSDWKEGIVWWHLLMEIVAAYILLLIGGYLVGKLLHVHQETVVLQSLLDDREKKVSDLQRELEQWRQENNELASGIHHEVEQQFERWKLSVSEKEIGLLLLRGESLKAVAAIRKTGEATVRQQCSEIYRKSGLAGRSELAAWFIKRFF